MTCLFGTRKLVATNNTPNRSNGGDSLIYGGLGMSQWRIEFQNFLHGVLLGFLH